MGKDKIGGVEKLESPKKYTSGEVSLTAPCPPQQSS